LSRTGNRNCCKKNVARINARKFLQCLVCHFFQRKIFATEGAGEDEAFELVVIPAVFHPLPAGV
jgi:hypothetical protein